MGVRVGRSASRTVRLARGAPAIPAMLGRIGMELFVEPAIRRLVGAGLGVGAEALVTTASLRDDLAADAVALVELTLDLEAEFGIAVPDAVVDALRTYGDLVEATAHLIRERREVESRDGDPPQRIWVRIRPPAGGDGGTLERADWLTSYVAELVVVDARRTGRGARVEVTVAGASAAGCARVAWRFRGLLAQGVDLTVRQGESPAAPEPIVAVGA